MLTSLSDAGSINTGLPRSAAPSILNLTITYPTLRRYIHPNLTMPLSHYGIPVGSHYVEMRDFYKAILRPLGYEMNMEGGEYCGFGTEESGMDFWLGGGTKDGLQKFSGKLEDRIAPVHVAFAGKSKEAVDEWYENAMYV